ncbi:uncharacterized protein YfbL-like isoform X2 [Haliotis asinina]|uniref:uncharacterized protein YfbL-like isoform X2 n=1 Tax=Haliotis asinina TaxID=109174 RepID=UPI003531A60F
MVELSEDPVSLTVPIVAGDAAFVRTALQDYFAEARHHVTNPDYKLKCKKCISTEFRNYGLETHEHSFTGENEVAAVNVIGILKGAMFNTRDDRVFGIAAHYDTVRNTAGVDDNGSSMVALLSAAKALSTRQRNYTLLFVAFDLEEWEYNADKACSVIGCGSEAFIRDWIPTYWATTPDIAGFVVMDTIMNFNETEESQTLPGSLELLFPKASQSIKSDDRQGDFLACIARAYDASLARVFQEAFNQSGDAKYELEVLVIKGLTGQTLTSMEANIYTDAVRSDHGQFWKKGIKAIFLTDTANFRGYMRACYHQQCDDMSRVTDNMILSVVKTARALIATGNKMAPALPVSPGPTGSGDRMGISTILGVVLMLPVLICV